MDEVLRKCAGSQFVSGARAKFDKGKELTEIVKAKGSTTKMGFARKISRRIKHVREGGEGGQLKHDRPSDSYLCHCAAAR